MSMDLVFHVGKTLSQYGSTKRKSLPYQHVSHYEMKDASMSAITKQKTLPYQHVGHYKMEDASMSTITKQKSLPYQHVSHYETEGASIPTCRPLRNGRRFHTTCRPLSPVLECFTLSLSRNLLASLCFHIDRIMSSFREIKFTVIIIEYLKLILKLNHAKSVILNSRTVLSSGI
jgi:hypothetical protein